MVTSEAATAVAEAEAEAEVVAPAAEAAAQAEVVQTKIVIARGGPMVDIVLVDMKTT